MKIKPKKIEVGDVFATNSGNSVVVIEYITNKNILVEFRDDTNYILRVRAVHLRSGAVRNPYQPSVYGIGFVGEGAHKTYIEGKFSPIYQAWTNMLKRCYDPTSMETDPSYLGCYVNTEWHNFQNFAEWYCSQPNEVKWQIDKDILVKGNREYCKERCSVVPAQINLLLLSRANHRGEMPLGVEKRGHKFYSKLSVHGKIERLGTYDCPETAFNAYKTRKEAYIKEMADLYKDKIRKDVYDAMYQYTIDITD